MKIAAKRLRKYSNANEACDTKRPHLEWSAYALKSARTLVPTTFDNHEVKSTMELAVE